MNTYLTGFGLKDTVRLERWGEHTDVTLPTEALEALKDACYDILPAEPPHKPQRSMVHYKGSGIMTTVLTVDQAQGLLVLMAGNELQGKLTSTLPELKAGLEHALVIHARQVDRSKDPGAKPGNEA